MQSFSRIQNHILSELKYATVRKYSELHPCKVPNDLFNYHLQFLVKKGFVARVDDGYLLTDNGKQHIADPIITEAERKISSLFKINVLTVVSRVVDGQIQVLNQKRRSHPSFGKIGVMGGVVYKGESLEDAASRKLREETGLVAKFKILGMERRYLYKNDQLFSDVLFPIAYASKYSGELNEETGFGQNLWAPIREAIKNESAPFDSVQSLSRVLRAIQRKKLRALPFFYDEKTQRE